MVESCQLIVLQFINVPLRDWRRQEWVVLDGSLWQCSPVKALQPFASSLLSSLPSYLYPEPMDPHDWRRPSNLHPVPSPTLPQHGSHAQQQQLRWGVRQWVVVQLSHTAATQRREGRREICENSACFKQSVDDRPVTQQSFGEVMPMQYEVRFGVNGCGFWALI